MRVLATPALSGLSLCMLGLGELALPVAVTCTAERAVVLAPPWRIACTGALIKSSLQISY